MKNQRLKQLIIEKYPNGFSFEPTALRLVEEKIGYMPNKSDLDEMKQEMFQRDDKVYLFCEHVADEKTLHEVIDTVEEWIRNFDCFALEVLQKKYEQKIKNILKIDDFTTFVEKLLFSFGSCKTTKYSNSCQVKITRSANVRNKDDGLMKLVKQINDIIIEKYCAADYEIIENIPAINSELLAAIIKDKISQIIKTDNSGTTCFQLAENHLPDDLSEKITESINKLESANLEITQEALHIVLSLLYKTNFNETYFLRDMRTFRRVIEKNYNNDDRNWKDNAFSLLTKKENKE
ncbi:MAG: hypothetical protein LBB88_04505 [Planctomycetaceae bacterium]|nr:hypothetical protein [Planctomycetaceae bacterium]